MKNIKFENYKPYSRKKSLHSKLIKGLDDIKKGNVKPWKINKKGDNTHEKRAS